MQERRRIVGGMMMLTIGGLLLLVPPLVYLFNHDVAVFGLPQIVVYLFGVWVALIAGTAWLTGRLGPGPTDATDEDG